MSEDIRPEQNDEEITSQVADFIREHTREETPGPEAAEEAPQPKVYAIPDTPPPAETETEAPKKAALQPDPALDPKHPTIASALQAYAHESDVTVSDEERQMFFQSLLHDKDCVLEIPVKTKGHTFKVTFSTRNMFANNVTQHALKTLQKEGVIFDPISYVSYIQQFLVAVGLRAIDDTEFDRVTFSRPFPKLDVAARKLIEESTETFGSMNQIRWVAAVKAARIFETKLAIVTTEINQGNF